MKRDLIAFTLVLIILALAIGLKFDRYRQDESASTAAAARHVIQLMERRGWKADGGLYIAGGVYEQLHFRRADCEAPIFVAFLRGNAEASEFFRRDHGGNVMFVQGADVVARPGGLSRMGSNLLQQIAEMLGFERGPVMPVLAVAPAADAFVSDCHGPSMADWQDRDIEKTFH